MKPSDVFVPGRFPLEPENVYADRGEPQRRVEQAWERGFVPVIYGSYGTGKSSLARFCSKGYEEAGKLVYIESIYGKSLAAVFERILEFLGYSVTIEQTDRREHEHQQELGFSLSGGIFATLKAKLSGKLSRKQKKAIGKRRELLIKSPTDGKLLDLCEENGLLLLIDELNRGSDKFREEISAFLKAYANRNSRRFTVGLIGTEDDAGRLVVRDPGIDRLLQEVNVRPISATEAKSIIVPGMTKLGLRVEEGVVERVVRAGVGSPFIVQYLCLEMSEAAVRSDEDIVTMEMFSRALEHYARSKAQRALKGYHRAIETTGKKRYRKQILHAMAQSENEYVTMEELVERVSAQLDLDVPSTALSGPLRDLKSQEYGEVLADVQGFRPDTRAYNYSSFSDPAMKAVIRLTGELEGDVTDYISPD